MRERKERPQGLWPLCLPWPTSSLHLDPGTCKLPVDSCPVLGFLHTLVGTTSLCRPECGAQVHRQGKVGVVMAFQGVLWVGFRACREMSGEEFAQPPCV